eukprot:TRINITY_DN7231_c0_g1_i3.p1 TRINITY_DN7231_c0_g1~~TRINITY_DN7231_c0_g1_i3.p1  ORF type:complete len:332 (+),score=70.48 TRINITY_DN7231_c0_g1_i3:1137-2132(+)
MEMEDQGKSNENEVKILLLGAGESGKSTIAKQMQIIHLNGFSDEELLAQKPVIHSNVIDSAQKLIFACNKFELDLDDETEEAGDFICDIDLTEDIGLTKEVVKCIKKIWRDESVKEAYSRSSEFQLNDSAEYFFKHINRISKKGYIPDEQDMLRVRKKTTGVIETTFVSDPLHFRMVDVGGQRNERKKWIHCFECVTAILFVVSLSEYDLLLEEDERTNRMHDSIELFAEIVNNQWFAETPVLLFLNKKDLFQKKIKKVNLKVCFSSYKGGRNVEKAARFIEKKFLKENKSSARHVYTHLTCATDTDNIRVVFDAVQEIFLTDLMGDYDLL